MDNNMININHILTSGKDPIFMINHGFNSC